MISFVEDKKIDWNDVQNLLDASRAVNRWTNYGPVQRMLEQKIKQFFPNKNIIMCSNGTVALNALAAMYKCLFRNNMSWVTSTFNFPSCRIGHLHDVFFEDCDESGIMQINDKNHNLCYAAGIILTDIFGTCSNIDEFQKFAKQNDKVLLLDSALALDRNRNNVSCDEIVSFHHTKPWGFGEGGCICVDENNVQLMESILNFGFNSNNFIRNEYLTNGKISEVSCAMILSRLNVFDKISKNYWEQFERIKKIALDMEISILGKQYATPASVPLLFKKPIHNLNNPYVTLRKYYKPLNHLINAKSIYERLVNFPCHTDVGILSDKDIKHCLELIN